MPEHDPTNSLNPTTKALEALLFAAPGLSSVEQLSQALNVSKSEVEQSLEALSAHLTLEHGLRLQKIRDQYQLITAPEHAEMIEKFLGLEVTSRLTQAALEVLAIVAYKQPTTRPEIDSIRGVNSDGVVKSLLAKGLIEELGRSEAIGRPILYGVTNEFFQHFGLESLDQLPAVDLEGLFAAKPSPETEETRFLKD
ncbi:MAG TPA: SMC-Scp complex subunit ScpB [Anaerolineaceae bacterium]|nr:SMC-Scp complex subunit ScpB [Anaerolineaceae bacterium]